MCVCGLLTVHEMLNDRIGPKLQSIICATTATSEGTVASDWSLYMVDVAPVNTGESSTVCPVLTVSSRKKIPPECDPYVGSNCQ